MPVLSATEDNDFQNGGTCPNITAYCHFGCCGNHDNQHCCFPIGVFIGCGFGILGTIFLLISLFRCRTTQARNQPQNTNEINLGSEYGLENQAYSQEGSTIQSITESHECPKYSEYLPPPSYETVMAEIGEKTIENNVT